MIMINGSLELNRGLTYNIVNCVQVSKQLIFIVYKIIFIIINKLLHT